MHAPFAVKHLNLVLNFESICSNPQMLHILLSHSLDKELDWDRMSSNSALKMDNVIKNPRGMWNWEYLSRNQNISVQDVLSHSKYPWNFGSNL